MSKELNELLNRIKKTMVNNIKQMTLTKYELHLILKYINELEKELAGEININTINDKDIKILVNWIKRRSEEYENNN